MDPLVPRRHTITEAQCGRTLTIAWSPMPVPDRHVEAVVVERPETWPAEGERVEDDAVREVVR